MNFIQKGFKKISYRIKNFFTQDSFRILTVDGGGIRGLFAAQVLKKIQDQTGVDYNKAFDFIAGTSVGAIIASAIATEYPLDKILPLFNNKDLHIFKKQEFSFSGLSQSMYSNENLKKQLNQVFQDKKLSQVKSPLILTATNINNGRPRIFFSYDAKDKDLMLVDILLASTAAPVYFPPYKVNGDLLADGGLWANNPSLMTLIQVMKHFKVQSSGIKVLSLGNGHRTQYYKDNGNGRWGLINWNKSLVDLVIDSQSKNVDQALRDLIPKNNYLRINFDADGNFKMADTSEEYLKYLQDKANTCVDKYGEEVKRIIY